MHKQIIYCKYIPRLFSTAIDISIIALIQSIIMSTISYKLFKYLFPDFIANYSNASYNVQEILSMTSNSNANVYLPADKMWIFILITSFCNILILGTYFIGSWKYKGSTIGKMLMGMKIVNAADFAPPTTKQLIWRFFGYATALPGIWFIVFSKNKQALHDKMAGTVVIKA